MYVCQYRTSPSPVRDRDLQANLDLQLSQVSIRTPDSALRELPRLKCEEEAQPSLEELKELRFDRDPLATISRGTERPLARRTGLTEDGHLAPPPQDAKYGPAAEPPLSSCRPGGPRLLDLLKELPLEPFGVLAWSIVDREEDLFEQDDLPDEDKVMLALWNRWIMFNRYDALCNAFTEK